MVKTRRLEGGLLLLMGLVLIAAGCAKPRMRCTEPGDNPEHHYLVGMNALERSDYEAARAKFTRALFCDSRYSPAHAGLAITYAEVAASSGKALARRSAWSELEQAKKYEKTPEEKFIRLVASIRVNTALRPRRWLKRAESDYKRAMKLRVDEAGLPYYRGSEAASYFMGLAYIEAKSFNLARKRFEDVLEAASEGKWNGPADRAWKRTDRIVRAIGGVSVGDITRQIALKKGVTRADLAALLVDELHIEKLFEERFSAKGEKEAPSAVDIRKNPFREEIERILALGIRGLSAGYDASRGAYLFRPSKVVTRKEFAFILEDLLIKMTGDESISRAFVGHRRSPFTDVPPTAAWYNAVMNVTTRGLMETGVSGAFRPDDPVDGPDAVLAIRVLKERLNIY